MKENKGTSTKFKQDQEVKVTVKQELFSSIDISGCLNLVVGRNLC